MSSVKENVRPRSLEFADRSLFHERFSGFVNYLSRYERDKYITQEDFMEKSHAYLRELKKNFILDEVELFRETFDLFCVKNNLPPFDKWPEMVDFFKSKNLSNTIIEMAGPLGSGKTTIAQLLATEMNARQENEKFTVDENVFLEYSYRNDGVMFRTQLRFLLDSVQTGIREKFNEGICVRDASVCGRISLCLWSGEKERV